MAYSITNQCIGCDLCRPQCPTGAIKVDNGQYWIDATLCNNCEGFYPEPQCLLTCENDTPVPYQAKKGRYKADARPITSSEIFSNGINNSFASAIVIWELCNVLTQRRSLPWQTQTDNSLYYERSVKQGLNKVTFRVPDESELKANAVLDALDMRAACMHLIYAAYATNLEKPWENEIVIGDGQIEEYLGLDKRKDLSKIAKLALIKELAQQPCQIQVNLEWAQHGKIEGFALGWSNLWHMQEIQHHFQEDDTGCRHLVGLTFRVKAGKWSQHFLNQQGYKEGNSFYQYGSLPKSLLSAVMRLWQQHEGAVRMMLWLLFKIKMGLEQRITVPTLMRVAYGADKIAQISGDREGRKRLIRTFENDLEALSHYGLNPIFDPLTYPTEIQPLWARLDDIPEDAELALEFWANDGSKDRRLTDASPRGKWSRLMNARILCFELPAGWEHQAEKGKQKQRKVNKTRKATSIDRMNLSSEQIHIARKDLGLSQRELAEMTGKSQSWIRDIERGRFKVKSEDRALLQRVLGIA
jgi:DNA-binding transcriptional regulator YiaG